MLPSYAFTGASSPKTVDLPNLEGIYRTAFEGCPALETVYIPLSVTDIIHPLPSDCTVAFLYAGTEEDWERIDFYSDEGKEEWTKRLTFPNE